MCSVAGPALWYRYSSFGFLCLTEIHAKTLQIAAQYFLDKLSDKINIWVFRVLRGFSLTTICWQYYLCQFPKHV